MIIVDYIFSFNLFWNFGLSNPYLGLVYILEPCRNHLLKYLYGPVNVI